MRSKGVGQCKKLARPRPRHIPADRGGHADIYMGPLRLTSRDNNKLRPTQAQTLIAAAILRHLYAVSPLTTGQAWDPLIATLGQHRQVLAAAFEGLQDTATAVDAASLMEMNNRLWKDYFRHDRALRKRGQAVRGKSWSMARAPFSMTGRSWCR
jgi:hypothetical protein